MHETMLVYKSHENEDFEYLPGMLFSQINGIPLNFLHEVVYLGMVFDY